MSRKIEETISIDAPLDEVFRFVDDSTRVAEWLPGMVETRNIIGDGLGKVFDWTYKMAGIPLKGSSKITAYQPAERIAIRSKGGVVSDWEYQFLWTGSATELYMTVEYTIPIPVLGKLAESLVARLNERELRLAMANIKDLCEA